MKIAILTLQHSNNYGAMLQAYALSKFLKSAGHEVFFINYYQDVPNIGSYLRKPLALLGKVLGKGAFSFSFLKQKIIEARGKSVEQDFIELFDDFRAVHLGIQSGPVHYVDLEASCPSADAFIVGSDQVWAADFVFSSPAYLLGFAPPGAKKISYAASFGKAKLERYLRSTFARHLREFHAVSVREETGVDIVRELSPIVAKHVLDPTFLVSDYSEILDYSLVPDGDYALVYKLGQSMDLGQWTDEATRALARSFKMPLYSVSTQIKGSTVGDVHHLQPTPGQLLALIEKARIFVTNSFHGTVFAIKFRTRFVTLARDRARDKQNLRLQELVDSVDAPSQFCEPFLPVEQVLQRATMPIDFGALHQRLQTRRFESAKFLTEALE